MKFQAGRLQFGAGQTVEPDEADGIPAPKLAKLRARRMAGIREAKDCLANLPGPDESLHVIATSRMDLTDVVNALIDRLGKVDQITIATLGYNAKNIRQMLEWLDDGRAKKITLLASLFFRAHNGALWEETLDEFRTRGQRAACCHSHAKVIALEFADGSRYSIEGSANLCGNGSGREQFALINDPGLCEWHKTWINELVDKHEKKANEAKAKP